MPILKKTGTQGSLVEKGFALQKQGKVEEALIIYRQILQENPRDFQTLQLIAVLAAEQNNYQEAIDFYSLALRIHPRHVFALMQRAICYQALNCANQAIADYSLVIQMNPANLDALLNRAKLYLENQDLQKALDDYEACTRLDPGRSTVWCDQGVVLYRLRKLTEAERCFQTAIQIDSGNPIAHNNLGSILQDLGQLEAAERHLKMALELRPNYSDAMYNLGRIYHQGYVEPEVAIKYYARASEMPNATLAKIIWNRALCHLTLGDYETGWRDYEARLQLPRYQQWARKFDGPLWLGDQSLAGKVILLHAEQGIGDTLQFVRFAPLIADMGATVILEVQKPLERLLRSVPGVAQVLAQNEPLPAYDYHCSLMSLPFAFKTTLRTIPCKIPYIFASQCEIAEWSQKIEKEASLVKGIKGEHKRRLRVGLVWNGGHKPDEEDLIWGKRRDVALSQIALLNIPQIDFYSLQKGNPAEAELIRDQASIWPGTNFFNYAADLTDFEATAALVENMDLVVSVDTAVAHLAAALGKPTWILNRFDGCFRWMLGRQDSPWYPSVRLYRQQISEDWLGVLKQVRADLLDLID
jgi:tetratricopeptide (TPR) repeat protein